VRGRAAIPLDPDRERAELEEYLGAAYDQRRLERHPEEVEREWEAIGDPAAFYRRSEAYLYDLTAFAMSATKVPYLEELTRAVAPGARVLDYGCGTGSDGLLLAELGYRVELADFASPSTAYLRWRLDRRGLAAPVHDLDSSGPPGGFDLAYAFDVIEHVEDPFAFLGELERRAALVLVNLLEPVPGDTALHHPLPIPELLDHVARQGLRRHRFLHGRSHLVLYAPGRPGPLGRLRARAVRRGAALAVT
jgi:SAM-dependent methyltransferase